MKLVKRCVSLFGLLLLSSALQARPNVIVMVADDLGWADVGFHGSSIETPSLDRLAAEGVELSRFYTTPICSPTRAALMTGRDPARLGVMYATIMPWQNNGIHPDELFMPQMFRDNGYQTAMIGKWHLGHSQQSFHPNNRGFEDFYGHLHTEVGYFPPFEAQGGTDFQRNGVTIDDQGYETFLLANEAERWIRARDKQRPFFIYMPFLAPHTPLEAPADLIEKYKEMPRDTGDGRSKNSRATKLVGKLSANPRPTYAAMVDAMDQAIGQVLKTLDEEGIADDTIVLFFSDNGGATYAGAGASNQPLRGGKGETFEGGIRVVSVMRWPEQLKGNARYPGIASVMDLMPTLAAAAGIEPKDHYPFDGENLWQALVSNKPKTRDKTLKFAAETPVMGSFSITAFDDRWKLVQQVEQDQLTTTVTEYLFDIQVDPNEYNNLASAHPDVVKRLADEIRQWRALYPNAGTRSQLVPPPGWRAPKDWSGYPQPLSELRDEYAPGMPPKRGAKFLDRMYGERSRLIYNCEPTKWLAGICRTQDKVAR